MSKTMANFNFEKGFVPYWNTFCLCLGLSFVCGFVEPFTGYRAIGFAFLVTVIVVGSLASRGVVFFAALLSALCWNFFFIPPRFTFLISSREDQILCLTYFIAALITGYQSRRAKAQARHEARDEFLEVQAQRPQPVRPQLRREMISPYEVVGSVLRRLGPDFSKQPFHFDLEPNVGLFNIDIVLVEQALVQVIEGLAPYPDPGNALNLSIAKSSTDFVFCLQSSKTTSLNAKLIGNTKEVIEKHGGTFESSLPTVGGLLVELKMPIAKNI